MGVLWTVYQVLERLLQLSPKQLFTSATFMQLIASIFFIVDLFTPDSSIAHVPNLINNIISNTHQSLLFYIGIFYFSGFFIYLIHFLIQVRKLSILKQSGNFETQHQWINLLADTQINLPAHLKIGLSDKINSPMVFGYFEPIILLPLSICNQLSNEEIKLILMHELAHILRNDYLVNVLVSITKIILWFNPFSYFICNKIVLLRELACDDFVIHYTNKPIVYSKALYQLAINAQEQIPDFAIGAVNNKEHELVIRIKNINNLSQSSFNYFKFSFSALGLIVTALLGTMMIANLSKIKSIHKNTDAIVFKKPVEYNSNKVIEHEVIKPIFKKNKNNKVNVNSVNIENRQFAKNSEESADRVNKLDYDNLINETRNWIKQRENPFQFANFTNGVDSLDNIIAERLLISSIIKSYQLKRTIIEQKIAKAQDKNEAFDYILNSKEWADIIEYEQWAKEYLGRHQQSISLPTSTTKQQIQY